jgi:hypothetical protein
MGRILRPTKIAGHDRSKDLDVPHLWLDLRWGVVRDDSIAPGTAWADVPWWVCRVRGAQGRFRNGANLTRRLCAHRPFSTAVEEHSMTGTAFKILVVDDNSTIRRNAVFSQAGWPRCHVGRRRF